MEVETGNMMHAVVLAIALAALGVASVPARAQEFNLVIRNHKFEPEEIRVPAGKRVSIYVSNEDATPEEFDRILRTDIESLTRVARLAGLRAK